MSQVGQLSWPVSILMAGAAFVSMISPPLSYNTNVYQVVATLSAHFLENALVQKASPSEAPGNMDPGLATTAHSSAGPGFNAPVHRPVAVVLKLPPPLRRPLQPPSKGSSSLLCRGFSIT